MKKLRQVLENLLRKEESFLDSETGEVNYIKVKDSADKIDHKLISILIENKDLKDKFFSKINDVYVFNINDFKFFLDESKVDNSYTQYANRIGLSDGKELLKNKDKVVLDFPFKDCVLEGGQTTEEGTDTFFEYSEKTERYEEKQGKRKEIFFNSVLAHDEIDRLFDPKAFTSWKRFTKDGEQEVGEIKRDKEGIIKENMIIKGNNLLTLYSLKKQFSGKVKLIYIDPPYNTGNDEFKYNDNFNHSTWLTFMKNRLEIARKLLRDDGTIAISIDNNELNYIQILLDEIFGEENKKNLITIKRSSVSGAKVINDGVVNVSEFVTIYSKNKKSWVPNRVFRKKDRDNRYNKFIINKEENYQNWKYTTILEAFSQEKNIQKSKLKKELGSNYEAELEKFIYDNSNNICRFAALDDKAISKEVKEMKYKSKKNSSKTFIVKREKYSDYYFYNGEAILFFKDRLIDLGGEKVFGELITDIWDDVLPNDLHNEGNITLKKGKKPEKLLQRIVELFSNKNDIVLDFFSGSGTTGAVALKLDRQFIVCEQLEYIKTLPLKRLNNVVIGDDQSGISKYVNWQGGGEFIYFEIAKWNERAKEEINNAKDLNELIKLFDTIYEKYFLNYNVRIKDFKEKIIKEENFKKLTLDEQKRMFLTMLDLNQMYVQESEMSDSKFGISKEDQRLTKEFYKN